MPVHFPFPVSDNDYWVSLPLEGLTASLLRYGIRSKTPHTVNAKSLARIMNTVIRQRHNPCKYCTQRTPTRLFLVLKPQENARIIGFVVCDTCNAQFAHDVAAP